MSKRKKHKNNRREKTEGRTSRKHKEHEFPRRGINMPGFWEIFIGIALLFAGAGLSYFTGNPKILYVGALGICVLIFYATHLLVLRVQSSKTVPPRIVSFGGLTPGDEPTPEPLPKGVPGDTVQLYLGDTVIVLSASDTPAFQKGGQTFLKIAKRDGLARISATIVDSQNQPICRIIDNEFQAFPDRAFNPKQPDDHSLLVRDSSGTEVLNVRFLNPTTIRLTGRFQMPNALGPIVITKEGVAFPEGGGFRRAVGTDGTFTFDMTHSPAGLIEFK